MFQKSWKWMAHTYKGISESFWTGHLEWELQMVQLSATRCNYITILWVSLVSFATIVLCVASQVFIVVSVYFIMTQSGNFWIHPCTLQVRILWILYSAHNYKEWSLSPKHTVAVRNGYCFYGNSDTTNSGIMQATLVHCRHKYKASIQSCLKQVSLILPSSWDSRFSLMWRKGNT
jgi:hypothetical protein